MSHPFPSNRFRFMPILICFVATPLLAIDDPMPTITVNGTAEVQVVPDEVILTFSIESREESLNATVQDNDAKIKAVSEFLKASEVEDRHIRTQVIHIRPIFDENNDRPKFRRQSAAPMPAPNASQTTQLLEDESEPSIQPIGYIARRQLMVTIQDLAAFEQIYKGLIERGVNDVSGFEFRTTELRKHKDEARLKAIRAAREKANAMARELGASLAAVQTINEESGYGFPQFASNVMSTSAGGDQASNTIAAGMIEISASVQVVFRLGEIELENQ